MIEVGDYKIPHGPGDLDKRMPSGGIRKRSIGTKAVTTQALDDLSVTTAKIGRLSVTEAKIADLAVTTAKIANAAITNAKIENLAVDTAKIANLAVTEAKIADSSITSAKIRDATITTADIGSAQITEALIADAAITSAKIADATITTADIGNAQITTAKIATAAITTSLVADGAITSAKIFDATIGSADIADASIVTAKIADLAVTDAKISNLTVAKLTGGIINTTDITVKSLMKVTDDQDTPQVRAALGDLSSIFGQPAGTTYGLLLADSTGSIMIDADGVHTLGLLDSAVVTAKLAPAAVTNPKVSSDAISTANVQNAAITTAKIANLAVTTALIADAAITSAKIQDLTVASADIADAAIVEAKIGSAAVTTAKIASLAVGTAQIADAAVTNAKIASLDAGKITTGFLDAARIAAGSITSEKIAAGAIQAEHIAIGSSVDRAIKKVNASHLPNALPQGGVLFHFDGSLQSTQGLQSLPGAVVTLRPREGRFGGAVAVEEGTTNLVPSNRLKFEGWIKFNDAQVTLTQNVEFPEIGRNDATRIRSTGGTSTLKYYTSIERSIADQAYTGSVYIKNIGSKPVRFRTQLGPSVIVNPGEWTRAIASGIGNGTTQFQLRFEALNVDDDLDFIAWGPQGEHKPFATSFVDGTRATGVLRYPQLLDKKRGTLSVWINPHVVVNYNNFFYMNLSTGRFLLFFSAGGSSMWDFGPANSGPRAPTGTIVAGQWTMHTLTWDADSGVYRYYVNGEFVGERQYVEPDSLPSALPTVTTYGALLDELLILPYAAREEEIRAWYELQAPFYDPTPHIDADAQPIRAGRGAVLINEDGLRGYKDGQVTFEINTSGDAWFGGDVQARTFILPVRPA